jgi:hypothetical protein
VQALLPPSRKEVRQEEAMGLASELRKNNNQAKVLLSNTTSFFK